MPRKLFPLIRYFSPPVSSFLLLTPLTPNAVTSLSILSGLAGGWLFLIPEPGPQIWGGVLFVLSYVLDNCDGEIARAKSLQSRFGALFDSFGDWIVHAAFFLFLGFGVAARFDQSVWIWVGLAGAAGATINYAISLVADLKAEDIHSAPEEAPAPGTAKEWIVYFFREIARADFCFILLVLAIFDAAWILLPAGAIGAQVYWLLQFASSKRFHV